MEHSMNNHELNFYIIWKIKNESLGFNIFNPPTPGFQRPWVWRYLDPKNPTQKTEPQHVWMEKIVPMAEWLFNDGMLISYYFMVYEIILIYLTV